MEAPWLQVKMWQHDGFVTLRCHNKLLSPLFSHNSRTVEFCSKGSDTRLLLALIDQLILAAHKREKVESREGITPRPSLLNLGVQLSLHPASDVLSLHFCSCGCNRGNFRELLEGCFSAGCDSHLHDGDVPSRH